MEKQRLLMIQLDNLVAQIKDTELTLQKYRYQNTHKGERVIWYQEKAIKYDIEIQQLKRQIATMKNIEPKGSDELQNLMTKKLEKLLFNPEKYSTEFCEIVSRYFEREATQYSRLKSKKKAQESDSDYINVYPVLCIKPEVPKIESSEILVITLEENTTYTSLLDIVFEYWQLEYHCKKNSEFVTPSEMKKDLIFTDEKLALMPIDERVLQFYYERGVSNPQRVVLLFRQVERENDYISFVTRENMRCMGTKNYQDYQLNIINVKKSLHQRQNCYGFFASYFEGLQIFIPFEKVYQQDSIINNMGRDGEILKAKFSKEEQVSQDLKQIYIVDDQHCLVISMIIVALVQSISYTKALTLVQVSTMLDSRKVNLEYMDHNILFGTNLNGRWLQIVYMNQFWDYFEEVIGATLLQQNSGVNSYLLNKEVIGTIRLRSLKFQNQQCERYVSDIQSKSCYSKVFTEDQEGRIKSHVSKGTNQYEILGQTSAQLGTSYITTGNFAIYSGNGYAFDINRDTSYDAFREEMVKIRESSFADSSSKIMVLSFTIYNPNTNIWIYTVLSIERDLNNLLVPLKPFIRAFVPNMYEGQAGVDRFRIDIIKIIISICFTLYGLYRVRYLGWRLKYFFLEVGGLDLWATIFTFLSALYTFLQSSKNRDSQILLNTAAFVDLFNEAEYYNTVYLFQSLNLLSITLRLSIIFKFNPRVNLVYKTINQGMTRSVFYIILVIQYLVGFSLALMALSGEKIQDYSNFFQSFASCLRCGLGNFKIENLSVAFSPMFLFTFLLFIFFLILFVTGMYSAFLIESFRDVIIESGYPSSKGSDLKLKYIFYWVFSWVLCWFDRENTQQRIQINSEQIELENPQDAYNDEGLKLTSDRYGGGISNQPLTGQID